MRKENKNKKRKQKNTKSTSFILDTYSSSSLCLSCNLSSSLRSLQIQIVFFFLTTKSMYHLLVISIHTFSSIIMIIFLLDIMIKTKHWNQFTMDISGPISILIYNNSTSPISLVCDPSYNVTSLTNLLNNFLFLNNYGIPFL